MLLVRQGALEVEKEVPRTWQVLPFPLQSVVQEPWQQNLGWKVYHVRVQFRFEPFQFLRQYFSGRENKIIRCKNTFLILNFLCTLYYFNGSKAKKVADNVYVDTALNTYSANGEKVAIYYYQFGKVAEGEEKRERRSRKAAADTTAEPKEFISGSSSASLGDLFKGLKLDLEAEEAKTEEAPKKKTTRKKKVEEPAE